MPGVRAVACGRDFPYHTGIYLKDQTVFAIDRVRFVGDPVAAVVLCQPQNVDLSVINGRLVVEDGRLTTLDLEPVLRRHNEIALAMARGEASR